MAKFARYDPTITGDSPVIGWYDTDFHDYKLPPGGELITITDDQWDERLDGSWAVRQGNHLVPYIPAPPTSAQLLTGKLAELAALRYSKETMGIAFQAAAASQPSTVATDRQAQSQLTSAFVAASAGHWPNSGAVWKMADGAFVVLTANDIEALGVKVQTYISACFAHEAQLASALANDTNTDITIGWPSNT